jgi:type III pantothenate kinase
VVRIVADLGNSRLKLAEVADDGRVGPSVALPTHDKAAWAEAWRRFQPLGAPESSWAISTVNPPAAEQLEKFLASLPGVDARWYRSGADVPIRHALPHPETAGADRALAVAASCAMQPRGRPGLLVLCGTAVTVERVSSDGIWQGGAITAGLGLTAQALHDLTAQLPLIATAASPPAWGCTTTSALEAGIFWGVVGAVRELLTRQAIGLEPEPWIVWTGGDAEVLASAVDWGIAEVVPDLVLQGLADIAIS